MRMSVILVLVMGFGCSGEEPPPPDLQAMKYTIWEIIEGYHRAGDQGDVSTMINYLDTNISLFKGGEDFVRGRDAVEDELTERAEIIKSEGRKTLLGDKNIDITGDMAVCTYVANVATLRAAVTVVMRRTAGGLWKIRHIHDIWPAPTPGE